MFVIRYLASWFSHPTLLWLLLMLPPLALSAWLTARRRRRLLARVGNLFVLWSTTSPRPGRRFLRGLCLVLGLVFLVVGMAGPRWGYAWNYQTASGRDIVVALDASRTMLAESPSRRRRAADMLLQLCDWAEKRGGHRLALVVFAGRAKVVCPLTHDYDHFRFVLQQQDPADLPPELRPRAGESESGTRMGAGIRAALNLHDMRFEGSQDILMLSDGDDPLRDREWFEGVKLARQRRIAVDVVGVGEPDTPKWIPLENGFLEFDGQPVETTLQEKPLREIAQQTHGVYIPAQSRTLPLGELYQEILDNRQYQRDDDDNPLPIRQPRYAWFLGAALILLTLAMVIGDGRRWQQAS